jgi:hypothetical protein
MNQEQLPKYIQNASFIEPDRDIQEDWWPRDPARYTNTVNWENRVEELSRAIEPRHCNRLIEHGKIYPAANGNVAFVESNDGVSTYSVVDAKLLKGDNGYPINPEYSDFRFKKVTFWAYVFDTLEAIDSETWSDDDLSVINSISS